MIKQEIESLVKKATGKEARIEPCPKQDFGDYSTNVAIQEKLNPNELVLQLQKEGGQLFEKIEVKNGFVNFFLNKKYLQNQVKEILKQKEKFGQPDPPSSREAGLRRARKIQVEFISANPTGPLTLGNGRGGFCGDVLANVLAKAGYKIEREYYVNDRGEQIKALGHSVLGDEQAVYQGDYIDALRHKLKPKKGADAERTGQKAAKMILQQMIRPTVKKMGIQYDKWFSEKSLYQKNEVKKTIQQLKNKGLTYEKEGALWFASTKFGDDKDRVLVKSDGEETYLASDVAYVKNKFGRGFDKLIWFLGADHYGYVARIQAVVEALGYKKEQAIFIVMQLVKLFRAGKEVRMSKRAGIYITLDELFDELCSVNPLGLDAARFFFLTRGYNTHLNFDLDLAKSQTEKNPVYYIQYAHARTASILVNLKSKNLNLKSTSQNLNLLTQKNELNLIKQLIKLPEVVEDITNDYQVQRLPKYATEVAVAFHRFYTDCRVIDETERELTTARLALTQAAGIVLKNTLGLMGIKAPNKM